MKIDYRENQVFFLMKELTIHFLYFKHLIKSTYFFKETFAFAPKKTKNQ